MEKIVLICADKEKNRDLVRCLEELFPECSLEVVMEVHDSNFMDKSKDENLKGEN